MVVRIEVFGRVQGVSFRAMVARKARELNLCGRVWNREDGSVEILVCGSAVDELVDWIKSSPGMSKVEDVTVGNVELDEDFDDFRVLRSGNFFKDQKRALGNLGRKIFG